MAIWVLCPNWNELTELEVKFSYPNLVDKSLCISPVRASGTIAFFRKGEYLSVFRKRPSLKSEKSVIYPLLDAFGVGSDVNYRQTFCRKHEALTKGSVGLLTALLVIK